MTKSQNVPTVRYHFKPKNIIVLIPDLELIITDPDPTYKEITDLDPTINFDFEWNRIGNTVLFFYLYLCFPLACMINLFRRIVCCMIRNNAASFFTHFFAELKNVCTKPFRR